MSWLQMAVVALAMFCGSLAGTLLASGRRGPRLRLRRRGNNPLTSHQWRSEMESRVAALEQWKGNHEWKGSLG